MLFGLFLVASWSNPSLVATVPRGLVKAIYPIDKTNLDILRLFHFLSMAYLVVVAVRIDAPFLRWRVSRPIILCGQHSLHVFCLGALLSFSGHFFLTEFNSTWMAQISVSTAGIVVMTLFAGLLTWYRKQELAAPITAPRIPSA
jgi:hypothetical protein